MVRIWSSSRSSNSKTLIIVSCQKGLMAFLIVLICCVSMTQPLYVKNHLENPQVFQTGSSTSSRGHSGLANEVQASLLGRLAKGRLEQIARRDNQAPLVGKTKTPGANQRAVHRKRRHHHHHHENNSAHLLMKRESQLEDSVVSEKIQQLCKILANQTNERWAFSPEVHIDGPSDIDPVPFGNRCHLYVRIKHPLFTTQKIGLVAGIQYQVDISLYGLCDEVVVHDGLKQPWFLLGVSSKYGSLEGLGSRPRRHCNSQDVLVLATKLGEVNTLSYIPSELFQDQLHFAMVSNSAEDLSNDQTIDVFVQRTINLPVINECLLSLKPKHSISLEDLVISALQTQSKGWPSPQWQICQYILSPALAYSLISSYSTKSSSSSTTMTTTTSAESNSGVVAAEISSNLISKNSDNDESSSCRLLYQFLDTFSHTNLTEALCLSNHSLKGSDDNSQITFQLSIPSYATMSSDLFNIVRKFKLVMSYSSNSYSTMKKRSSSNVKRYVDDEENWCGTGLVAFDYSLVNHSMVDYELQQTTTGVDDNGDAVERGRKSCVVKLHLPYGYATKLQFSQEGSGYNIKASPNCSYIIGNDMVHVHPTLHGARRQDGGDVMNCYYNHKENLVVIESNQITLILQSMTHVQVKGEIIPHLIGNCHQDESSHGSENLWLQLGNDHCIQLQKVKKSWIKAKQFCQEYQGQDLLALHNAMDEKLVQSLLLSSPKWQAENAIWIGASDTKQEGNFMWTDGTPMDYTNWFPGWIQGRSEPSSKTPTEDCVELRQSFPGVVTTTYNENHNNEVLLLGGKAKIPVEKPVDLVKNHLYWNDQECRNENLFLCAKTMVISRGSLPPNAKPLIKPKVLPECVQNIELSVDKPFFMISAKALKNNLLFNCTYHISAFKGGEIVIEFQEFNVDGVKHGQNANCLESDRFVVEQQIRGLGWRQIRRYCGNWNEKLKAIHVVTKTSSIRIGSMLYPMHKNEKSRRGFVVKVLSIPKSISPIVTNVILEEGTSGKIYSTNFPLDYPPLRTQTTHIVGPKGTKIRLRFQNITLESSEGCKYDSIVVSDTKNVSLDRSARICGVFNKQEANRYHPSVYTFESHSNELWVMMNSDETVAYSGFLALWEALPLKSCENKTIRGVNSGFIQSPGYPDEESTWFEPPLDCWTFITAPVDHRVVLSFEALEFVPSLQKHQNNNSYTRQIKLQIRDCAESNYIEFLIQQQPQQSLKLCLDNLGLEKRQKRSKTTDFTDLEKTKYSLVANASSKNHFGDGQQHMGELVSSENKLAVRFFSKQGKLPGQGFRAKFKIESFQFTHTAPEFKVKANDINVDLLNVNHPLSLPKNLKHQTTMTSPSGTNLQLIVPTRQVQQNCSNGRYVQIEDPYRSPTKFWQFCHFLPTAEVDVLSEEYVMLQSYLNMLKVIQNTNGGGGGGDKEESLKFQIKVKTVVDEDVVQKVLQLTKNTDKLAAQNTSSAAASITANRTTSNTAAAAVAFIPMGQPKSNLDQTCDDNLCFNGGYCDPMTQQCQCRGHYIGRYCLQTSCDLHPCQNGGVCSLTSYGYLCSCPRGFGGPHCSRSQLPCENKPCVNGICIEDGTKRDGYRCQCHLWWIGSTCERRIKNIPFKPLSERMMEEPFWLGLLAVFVVLGILGTGYMLKKHLPEKFDKYLQEGGSDGNGKNKKDRTATYTGGHGSTGGGGQPSFAAQASLSEAADAILGHVEDHHRGANHPGGGTTSDRLSDQLSPGAVAKSLLGKFTMRKASVLSISSIGSFADRKSNSSTEELYPNGNKRSPRKNNTATEEERRKILKMLVTPQTTKRTVSSASFDSMVIKAARSAENINSPNSTCSNGLKGHSSKDTIIRKESSSSLQIPGLLRRTNSDSNTKSMADSNSDLNSKKVVTFSQVVDQMACSFSESSSLSDLSSCTEDFRQSVSSHVPRRTARKLMRSSRIGKRHGKHHVAAVNAGYFGRSFPLGHTSGSEDLYESSMESIESNNAASGLTLHPLSALNTSQSGTGNSNAGVAGKHMHKLQKISSADSLMSMIKNLASNRMSTSTPSSPQLSENGDISCSIGSSGFPTPLTTPDTPCASKTLFSPRSKESLKLVRKISSGELGGASAASASSSPSMSPTRSSSQIMVEVLDPLNPRKDQESGDKIQSANPTITLEVPNFAFGKCLSPIKELPSPIPTPIPSPIPFQRSSKGSQDELGNSSTSSSSSGKSSSHNSKKLISMSSKSDNHQEQANRRSSFTAFCKKAANAGRNRRCSGQVELIKSSMSTSDDDMIPMQELGSVPNEISIVVPVLVPPKPSGCGIPIIVLTEPDHEPYDTDAEEEEVSNDKVLENKPNVADDVPEIAVSPPSPKPERKDTTMANNISSMHKIDLDDLENNDSDNLEDHNHGGVSMPMIKITIESPVESLSSPSESPNEHHKQQEQPKSQRKKPPPISIPNSNFHNSNDHQVVGHNSQNISKDAMSKPVTPSTQSCHVTVTNWVSQIELGENRSTTPNNINTANTNDIQDDPSTMISENFREIDLKKIHIPPAAAAFTSTSISSTNKSVVGKFTRQKLDTNDERKYLKKQLENILEDSFNLNDENTTTVIPDSPKYLIPPEKFDSTPRSRSQSVELPDFIVNNISEHTRKLSLNPTTIANAVSPAPILEANVQEIGVNMAHPPMDDVSHHPPTSPLPASVVSTDLSQESLPDHDEGLVALMRSRSGQSIKSSTSSTVLDSSWSRIKLGSPPSKRPSIIAPSSHHHGHMLKSSAFDLSPAITISITPMSEVESDADTSSGSLNPVIISTSHQGMSYLSPFSTVITTCSSRTTSESNLSSSGYSSMASPGPSRSGSSNPLCISESEDTSTPTKINAFFPKGIQVVPSSISGSSIITRRPTNNVLLKSPSMDSESSDPIISGLGLASHHHHHHHHGRQPKISGAAERRLLMASRYRTDSETTDEQCIPESISEAHDSAIDSTEDIAEEVEDEILYMEEDMVDPLDQEVASALPLTLEVQSSTESDKTVLSLKHNNYNNNKAGISVSGDDLNNSVPNSPGGGLSLCNSPRSGSSNNLITTISRHKLSLNLPEIIVQPCSPPPTSPSLESSPTSNNNVDINKKESSSSTNSSSSSISLGPAVLAASSSVTSNSNTSSKSNSDLEKKCCPIKSRSVPPMMLSTGLTSTSTIDYEAMSGSLQKIAIASSASGFVASAPISASSSRSESPLSDRYCGKCSSLISLHLRTIDSDGGLFEYSSEVKTASTQTRPQSKRKQKRDTKRPGGALSFSRGSAPQSKRLVKSSLESGDHQSTSLGSSSKKLVTSGAGKKLLIRSQGCKAETSSSNESLYSAKMVSHSSKTNKYTTDHSSSDESGGEAIAFEGGVTSPPVASSPSCSSSKESFLKGTSTSSTTSKQNSPMGGSSSLGLMLPIPGATSTSSSNKQSSTTRPLSTSTRPKTKRKSTGGHRVLP